MGCQRVGKAFTLRLRPILYFGHRIAFRCHLDWIFKCRYGVVVVVVVIVVVHGVIVVVVVVIGINVVSNSIIVSTKEFRL